MNLARPTESLQYQTQSSIAPHDIFVVHVTPLDSSNTQTPLPFMVRKVCRRTKGVGALPHWPKASPGRTDGLADSDICSYHFV